MHARLLLPGLLRHLPARSTSGSAQLARGAGRARRRHRRVVGGVPRLAALRPAHAARSLNPQTVFISNERNSWITATGNAPPGDGRRLRAGPCRARPGRVLARAAQPGAAGHQEVLVDHQPVRPDRPGGRRAGPLAAAVHPGRQPPGHRGDRLPGRARRLRLRHLLAGQSRSAATPRSSTTPVPATRS